MRNQTPFPPLFTANSRPNGAAWTWEITLAVASSGYVTKVHAIARRIAQTDSLVGVASCRLSVGDDVSGAIQDAAIEAMLAACEPNLFQETPTREFEYRRSL